MSAFGATNDGITGVEGKEGGKQDQRYALFISLLLRALAGKLSHQEVYEVSKADIPRKLL